VTPRYSVRLGVLSLTHSQDFCAIFKSGRAIVAAMAQIPAIKRRRLSPTLASGERGISPSTLGADPNGDYLVRASRWDLEQDYEQRPRKLSKRETENTKLPVKTPEGRIEQLVVPIVAEVEEAESDLGFSSGDDEAEDEQSEQEVVVELSPGQQIIEAKEELARIAGLLNEDPEENVSQGEKERKRERCVAA
jgi:nucleolar complex protein 3